MGVFEINRISYSFSKKVYSIFHLTVNLLTANQAQLIAKVHT